MVEVVDPGIVVELEVRLVACLLKQLDDPCLLLWRQHLLATMVAVVGAVAAEIDFYLVAQLCLVLRLHILEDGVKAPRHQLGLAGLEKPATLFAALHRVIDGRSPVGILGQMLSCQKVQTVAPPRTVAEEAHQKAGWHITKIKRRRICFHTYFLFCSKVTDYSRILQTSLDDFPSKSRNVGMRNILSGFSANLFVEIYIRNLDGSRKSRIFAVENGVTTKIIH